MLNEPTIEKLQALRLDAMAARWAEQQKTPTIDELAFDERFGLLVDAEWLARENKRLGRAAQGGEAAARAGVHRGHRLPGAARARQGGRAPARHVPLGAGAPERDHHRRDRHREDLRRVRARAAGVPQGLPRALPARVAALRRARARARRRHLHPPAQQLARVDVLVIDDWGLAPAARPGAPRPPRDPRGPLRRALDDHHQPAAADDSGTTTSPTRPSPTPSRPHPPQRPPARAKGPLDEAEKENKAPTD